MEEIINKNKPTINLNPQKHAYFILSISMSLLLFVSPRAISAKQNANIHLYFYLKYNYDEIPMSFLLRSRSLHFFASKLYMSDKELTPATHILQELINYIKKWWLNPEDIKIYTMKWFKVHDAESHFMAGFIILEAPILRLQQPTSCQDRIQFLQLNRSASILYGTALEATTFQHLCLRLFQDW